MYDAEGIAIEFM